MLTTCCGGWLGACGEGPVARGCTAIAAAAASGRARREGKGASGVGRGGGPFVTCSASSRWPMYSGHSAGLGVFCSEKTAIACRTHAQGTGPSQRWSGLVRRSSPGRTSRSCHLQPHAHEAVATVMRLGCNPTSPGCSPMSPHRPSCAPEGLRCEEGEVDHVTV